MCCTQLAGNTGGKNDAKKSPSLHYRTTLSGSIFATKACIDNRKKNLLNSNIFSRCLLDMANFSPLTAEIYWRVWDTPANINGFGLLASLLHRRHSLEANQTLHDFWPSPGLVCFIYTFGGSCPLIAQYKIHFTSKSCVLVYWQHYCTALLQRALAKLCGVVQGMELRNFRRGRHLYLAGRPSRWALAHISSVGVVFILSHYSFPCVSRISQKN